MKLKVIVVVMWKGLYEYVDDVVFKSWIGILVNGGCIYFIGNSSYVFVIKYYFKILK